MRHQEKTALFNSLHHISQGLISTCPDCQAKYKITPEEVPSFGRDIHKGFYAGEESFSAEECSGCRTTLGGYRAIYHGVRNDDQGVVHLVLCNFCGYFAEFGEDLEEGEEDD